MEKAYRTRKDQTFTAAKRACNARALFYDMDSAGLGGCSGPVVFRAERFDRGPDGYPELVGTVFRYTGDGETDDWAAVNGATWRAPMADLAVA